MMEYGEIMPDFKLCEKCGKNPVFSETFTICMDCHIEIVDRFDWEELKKNEITKEV